MELSIHPRRSAFTQGAQHSPTELSIHPRSSVFIHGAQHSPTELSIHPQSSLFTHKAHLCICALAPRSTPPPPPTPDPALTERGFQENSEAEYKCKQGQILSPPHTCAAPSEHSCPPPLLFSGQKQVQAIPRSWGRGIQVSSGGEVEGRWGGGEEKRRSIQELYFPWSMCSWSWSSLES